MLNISDEIEVVVEKMLYEGQALARYNDFTIFIENGCAGDTLKIKITNLKKNYANAEIVEIVKPSKHRVKPFCPLHNACGGCQWQYISYDEQLNQKQNIIKETVKKIMGQDIEIKPIIPSPMQQEYRHKIQYPVSQTKVSKRVLAGYYKKNSHEIVNIKYCPVQPRIIDEITEFIRQEVQSQDISIYNEKNNKGLLRHIVFKHSKENNNTLVILVVNSKEIPESIDNLASKIYKNFKNIIGISINFNTSKSNVILGRETKCLIGDDYYQEKIGGKTYQISANSFFQVNPYSAEIILNQVKSIISKNFTDPTVLDAYSGVASFGIYVSDIVKDVVCVEEVESASNDANTNKFLNNAQNVQIINEEASRAFEKLLKDNKCFDIVVLDPPRKGCSEESLDYVSRLSNKAIIYVSCNPATLARDLKYLKEKGFEAKCIQPVDMFPHTYHIENIAFLNKMI